MRMSKRVVWLCLAGCCCAGLWLTTGARANTPSEVGRGGEVKDELTAYCVIGLYFQNNGVNYYAVSDGNNNCQPTGCIPTTEIYTAGCPCTDPIYTSPSRLLPLPKSDETADLAPKPDPLFSGVLR